MTAERQGPVAGVVLAAGASSRMGQNKLLLTLGGSTVLRRAAVTAAAAGLDPVLVVLGHEGERARAELAGLACRPVLNPLYRDGQTTSLRCGFSQVPDEAAAAVVLLADMPLVTAEMIRALVARYRAGSAPLVVSVYGGVTAPPMLYGRALFAELRALTGGGCGKGVVKRHLREVEEVAWPASALVDLDEPADAERVGARLEGG